MHVLRERERALVFELMSNFRIGLFRSVDSLVATKIITDQQNYTLFEHFSSPEKMRKIKRMIRCSHRTIKISSYLSSESASRPKVHASKQGHEKMDIVRYYRRNSADKNDRLEDL